MTKSGKMRNTMALMGFGAILTFGVACNSDTTEPPSVDDELAGESARDGELASAKADTVTDNWNYFEIRHDMRKCISPLCGGYWVSRANRALTYCRGEWLSECYVPSIDWSGANLTQEDFNEAVVSGNSVLLKGLTKDKNYGDFGNLGIFAAQELWSGYDGEAAGGIFTRVTDSGIVCIQAPCNSLHEAKLNSVLERNLGELDFSAIGLSDEETAAAYAQVTTADGLLVRGYGYWSLVNGTWSPGRLVTQFYTRVSAAVAQECYKGGCSSHVCTDNPELVTTCEWQPQYACYADAICERQPGGECGFTETAELDACLADI